MGEGGGNEFEHRNLHPHGQGGFLDNPNDRETQLTCISLLEDDISNERFHTHRSSFRRKDHSWEDWSCPTRDTGQFLSPFF